MPESRRALREMRGRTCRADRPASTKRTPDASRWRQVRRRDQAPEWRSRLEKFRPIASAGYRSWSEITFAQTQAEISPAVARADVLTAGYASPFGPEGVIQADLERCD